MKYPKPQPKPKPERRRLAMSPIARSTKRIRTRRPAGTVRMEAKAAGDLTEDQWARICEFYTVEGSVRCAYCGSQATQQEHVVPIGKGGAHTAGNVVTACEACNSRKGLQTWPVPLPHPYMTHPEQLRSGENTRQ